MSGAGTGITDKELKRLAKVLAPLHVPKMPLAEAPPRDSRLGLQEMFQPSALLASSGPCTPLALQIEPLSTKATSPSLFRVT